MAHFIHVTQIKSNYGGEHHFPACVNVETIRGFYPRHDGKPGTRLTFADGGGFAVTEAFDQILVAVGVTVTPEITRYLEDQTRRPAYVYPDGENEEVDQD
jgi:hypothetical protein